MTCARSCAVVHIPSVRVAPHSSVHGELTTGDQWFDKNTTLYTELIQQVANSTNVPITTLHQAMPPFVVAPHCMHTSTHP